MSAVISFEKISKAYRLGQISTGTFTNDMKLWWAKMRGKPNPLARIGETDHGNHDGETIWALKDVSFTVGQGEVLGIIGRNGAGKSTLLKILSRVTAPTLGRIRVKGRVASLLEVGTGFHPELTGSENIYLNGTILGMNRKEIDRKFDEIVDFAELDKFIDTPVKRYSSGMYVRLAFAVAAHLEPEILVVDEVLAVGDAEFQKKCLGKMGEVAMEGRTVLFVSHNIPSIQLLCSRVVLLSNGHIICDDLPDPAISIYLKPVSQLVGDSNILTADRRSGSGLLRITKWQLIDDKLGVGNRVGCNHGCEFHLFYSSITELRQVSISLVIKDSYNQPVVSGSTFYTNQDFVKISAGGKFICRFPTLPLIADRYKLYLWISVDGHVADLVEDAGFFDVVASDVFGTGKFPLSKHGKFLLQNQWDVEPMSQNVMARDDSTEAI